MIYPRIIEKNILNLLDRPEILILYGPRRVGKTTLLKKICKKLEVKLPALVQLLSYQIGNPVNMNEIAMQLGISEVKSHLSSRSTSWIWEYAMQ